MDFNIREILFVSLIGVIAGRAIWNWAFKRHNLWVQKKRAFAALAAQFKAGNPDSWLGRFFDDVAFGDIHDAAEELCEFAEMVEDDPQAFVAEVDKSWYNLLTTKAKDVAQLALIQARIVEATQPPKVAA